MNRQTAKVSSASSERLKMSRFLCKRKLTEKRQNCRKSAMWSAEPDAQSVIVMFLAFAVDRAAGLEGPMTYEATQDKISVSPLDVCLSYKK